MQIVTADPTFTATCLFSNQKKIILRFILVKIHCQLPFAWPSAAAMLKHEVIVFFTLSILNITFHDAKKPSMKILNKPYNEQCLAEKKLTASRLNLPPSYTE